MTKYKFSENSEKGVDSHKKEEYYNLNTERNGEKDERRTQMLTKGLNIARAYFYFFRSTVAYYFAYFRMLKIYTFA